MSEVQAYKHQCSSQPGAQVRGLAVLDDRLYVARKNSAQIDVLHPIALTALNAVVQLPAATDPCSMAACRKHKSLYVTCFKNKQLLKVSVAAGASYNYTVSQKKQDTKLLPITFPNVN